MCQVHLWMRASIKLRPLWCSSLVNICVCVAGRIAAVGAEVVAQGQKAGSSSSTVVICRRKRTTCPTHDRRPSNTMTSTAATATGRSESQAAATTTAVRKQRQQSRCPNILNTAPHMMAKRTGIRNWIQKVTISTRSAQSTRGKMFHHQIHVLTAAPLTERLLQRRRASTRAKRRCPMKGRIQRNAMDRVVSVIPTTITCRDEAALWCIVVDAGKVDKLIELWLNEGPSVWTDLTVNLWVDHHEQLKK